MNGTIKGLIAAFVLCAAVVSAHAGGKEDALFAAAKDNDAAEILRLVKTGADVNAKNDAGFTAIHYVLDDGIKDLLKKAGATE